MHQRLQQSARQIYPGSRVITSRPLTGGVSAQVTAFELELEDGSKKHLVLRQYGETDVTSNPAVAETEYRLLKLLHGSGNPVPEPHYYDSSCRLFPGPIIVTDFVEGETVFNPSDIGHFFKQMISQLLQIHRIDQSSGDLSLVPCRQPFAPAELRERLLTVDPTLRHTNVEPLLKISSAPFSNATTLLHGDYWPGNILWRDSRIAAVIDWEDARIGDPLADVANSRLELLWAFGSESMDRFTRLYQAASSIDFAALPYWDLCVAVGPAANFASWTDDRELTERRRRRLRRFIRDALSRLG